MKRGRKVLVVGATGRLGGGIGRALAHRGDRPVLTSRSHSKLETLSGELGEPGGPGAPFVCADLVEDDAPDAIVRGIRATVGRVDDVIIACGPFPRTPFETLRRDDLWKALTVQAVAPLLLVHALAE